MEMTKIDVDKIKLKGCTLFIYPVDKNRKINSTMLLL